MSAPHRDDSDNTLLFKIADSLSSGGGVGPAGPTGDTGATGATGATGPAGVNTVLTVNATGTAYTLTDVLAFVNLGTIDPTLVITSAGTWRITGRIRISRVAATFSVPRFVTAALQRTNNTPGLLPIGGYGLLDLSASAGYTSGGWIPVDVIYTTVNSDDSISWYASINVLPTAGAITIQEAGITAQKIS